MNDWEWGIVKTCHILPPCAKQVLWVRVLYVQMLDRRRDSQHGYLRFRPIFDVINIMTPLMLQCKYNRIVIKLVNNELKGFGRMWKCPNWGNIWKRLGNPHKNSEYLASCSTFEPSMSRIHYLYTKFLRELYRAFKKELYNGISNVNVWRVLRNRLHLERRTVCRL
jgi:hypothetical protein